MPGKLRGMPVCILSMALLIGLAVAQAVLPDGTFSAALNRPLAQAPALSTDRVLSGRWMQEMETYVNDQFPGRDGWMGLKAAQDTAMLRRQRNGILLGAEGWLFEPCANLGLGTASQNMASINALAHAAQAPVTVMIVPLSSAVYPERLPGLYRPDDPHEALAALHALAPDARAVDALGALGRAREGEGDAAAPLFFRTDHHWTDAGAEVAYAALLAAWDLPAVDGPTETTALDGMYGSYYARAPSPWIHGEAFTMTQPSGLALSVDGEAMPGLYDPALMAESRDKYARLLYGNHGRLLITGGAEAGGTLLVIKDSYANMLLPKLARHFARVEAVDPRYYGGDLAALINETEADAILCLYGLTTLLTDRSLLLQGAA